MQAPEFKSKGLSVGLGGVNLPRKTVMCTEFSPKKRKAEMAARRDSGGGVVRICVFGGDVAGVAGNALIHEKNAFLKRICLRLKNKKRYLKKIKFIK
ncbi:MAG: hypothetical protein LAT75_07835 [Candidatus Cyclonatronum sp.]|uniref:hypothetical protein n=1 Tax=Cyclonatronum sp. TaxID=3024185 RepID=UPI0025BD41E7|nr:hypothetical protein [Cyclonatronum sp.]MCH8486760.1 hypothetical protein [Cyclonatronum sp.]